MMILTSLFFACAKNSALQKARIRFSFFIALLCSFATNFCFANGALEDMHGHTFNFSELQGKWVFVNYWASWCKPCLDEIPELNRFYKNQKKDEVVLFAVNYDAIPINQQEALIKTLHIEYPSLKKDPAHALALGDIRGIPVTFVFDPKGQLYDALYGQQTSERLSKIIRHPFRG